MSLRADGTYRCDQCNADVVNGSAQHAVTISGADPEDPRRALILHLCLPREEDGKRIPGCRNRVLTRAAWRNYHEKS